MSALEHIDELVTTRDVHEHAELVARAREVDEDDALDEPAADALVGPVLGHAKDDAEFAAEVGEALLARLEAVRLKATEQELDPVRQERVVLLALDETLKDLEIRGVDKRFENEHEGDHVLVLAPGEAERRAAGRKVVHCVGDGRLVGPDAADLGAERRVARSALGERRPQERDDVVPTREDEEPDKLLVSVDEEVAAERGRLFAVGDERLGRGRLEVAPVRLRGKSESR